MTLGAIIEHCTKIILINRRARVGLAVLEVALVKAEREPGSSSERSMANAVTWDKFVVRIYDRVGQQCQSRSSWNLSPVIVFEDHILSNLLLRANRFQVSRVGLYPPGRALSCSLHIAPPPTCQATLFAGASAGSTSGGSKTASGVCKAGIPRRSGAPSPFLRSA